MRGILRAGRQFLGVSRWILSHPANRGRRVRRYCRAVGFQLLARLVPAAEIRVRIGAHSHIAVRRHDISAMKCLYANPPDPEMQLWAQWLRPGDLFVDVGANSGAYTLWAADRGASVIAVEPDSQARQRLLANVTRNGYVVQVVPSAVGDRTSRARFSVGQGPMNHLLPAADENGAGVEADVDMVTLDEVIGDRVVAGVKIDVEGAERLVLLGAGRALREHRIGLLQLEWNRSSVALLGETREPVRALLESFGYRAFRPGHASLEMGDADVFAVSALCPPAFSERRVPK